MPQYIESGTERRLRSSEAEGEKYSERSVFLPQHLTCFSAELPAAEKLAEGEIHSAYHEAQYTDNDCLPAGYIRIGLKEERTLCGDDKK